MAVLFFRNTLSNVNYFQFAHPIWWLLCDGGLYLTYYIGYTEEIAFPVIPVYQFAMIIFKTQEVVKNVFIIAFLMHFAEAMYAAFVARKKGCSVSRCFFWFLQTVFLGFPSLSILLARPVLLRNI